MERFRHRFRYDSFEFLLSVWRWRASSASFRSVMSVNVTSVDHSSPSPSSLRALLIVGTVCPHLFTTNVSFRPSGCDHDQRISYHRSMKSARSARRVRSCAIAGCLSSRSQMSALACSQFCPRTEGVRNLLMICLHCEPIVLLTPAIVRPFPNRQPRSNAAHTAELRQAGGRQTPPWHSPRSGVGGDGRRPQ